MTLNMSGQDGGYGWMVVGACIITQIFLAPVMSMNGLLFEAKYKEIAATPTQISIFISAFLTAWNVSALFVGPLVKMRSARFVAFCGTAIASAGFVISAFASSVSDFVFVFILLGVGLGVLGTNSFLIIRQYFKRRVGLACGVFAMGVGSGNFFMPQVVKLLLSSAELKKNIILIYTGIHALSFIGVLLMRDFKPSKMDPAKEGGTTSQNPEDVEMMEDASSEVVEKLMDKSSDVVEKVVNKSSDVVDKLEDNSNKGQESGNCWCCQLSSCQKFTIFRMFSMINWSLLKRLDFLIMALGESVIFVSTLLYVFQMSHVCLEKGLSTEEVADILTVVGIMDILSRLGHGAVGDMACVNNFFRKPKIVLLPHYLRNNGFHDRRLCIFWHVHDHSGICYSCHDVGWRYNGNLFSNVL